MSVPALVTMSGLDDGVDCACPYMVLPQMYYDVMLTKVEWHHAGWKKQRYQTEDWVVKKWWKRKAHQSQLVVEPPGRGELTS